LKKLLPFFSYAFHPIFVPLLGTLFYILFNEDYYSKEQHYLLVFQVIIITIFLPMSFFYLLKTFGKIDSIMMSEINQRKIPLLLQVFLTFILLKQSITIERFPELFYFFLGGFITTIIAFLLLFVKIKASIHMMGMSILTFFVIGLSVHIQINIIYTIATLIALTGLIASSRLYMKAHTLNELIIGYFCGMIPQIILWRFWL
jgi:hypothetical protein